MELLKVKDVKPKDLDGLSNEQIDEHWALYEKYVERVNYICNIDSELKINKDNEVLNNYRIDLAKQLAFERNGVVLHELYFQNLKSGIMFSTDSKFHDLILTSFDTFDEYLDDFRTIAKARGENWIMTVYDMEMKHLRNVVIDSHEHYVMYQNVPLIVMDNWTHSYAVDYSLADRTKYVEVFIKNIDWDIVEIRSSHL
jgi:Fe-Mn family superoxide dismutase